MARTRIGIAHNIGSHVWYARQLMVARQIAVANDLELIERDANDDPKVQVAQILEILEIGIDVLLLSAVRPDDVGVALDACLASSVRVITESIAVDHPSVISAVRVDDFAAGLDLGRVVGSRVIQKDEVPLRVLLSGFNALPEAHAREHGFIEGLRSYHPNLMALYVDGMAQVKSASERTREALNTCDRGLNFVPDVIFGVDDESVIGAVAGVRETGRATDDAVTATFGVSPPSGLELLDSGLVTFGQAMFPEVHSALLMSLAQRAVRGEAIPVLVNPPFAVVASRESDLSWARFYRENDDGGFELRSDVDNFLILETC